MRRRHALFIVMVTLAAACKKEPAKPHEQEQDIQSEPAPQPPPPKPWKCPLGTEKLGDAGKVHVADCMPPATSPACGGEYGEWLKKNCPGAYVTW